MKRKKSKPLNVTVIVAVVLTAIIAAVFWRWLQFVAVVLIVTWIYRTLQQFLTPKKKRAK